MYMEPSTPAENSQTGVSTNYVQPTSKPLIVPDRQMESLKIICGQQEADNIVVPNNKHQFEKGETVQSSAISSSIISQQLSVIMSFYCGKNKNIPCKIVHI